MQSLPASTCLSRLNLFSCTTPICTQLRWRKQIRCRKPKYLPMAPSKLFRIPEHRNVPEDENQLRYDLLEEYYRKTESLRNLFQEEINQNPNVEQNIMDLQSEEKEFRLLLEENIRENERIKPVREKIQQKEFEEKQWEALQLAEEHKKEVERTKLRVEEIVRMEKAKSTSYITKENLDESIELAIDSPMNIGFSLSLSGSVNWDGKPSIEYEADIQKRISNFVTSK